MGGADISFGADAAQNKSVTKANKKKALRFGGGQVRAARDFDNAS